MISHISRTKYDDLVPSGLLNEDVSSESLIQHINQLILEKQKMAHSATDSNPTYVKIEEQIRSLKTNLTASLRRSLSSLNIIKMIISVKNLKCRKNYRRYHVRNANSE